MSLSNPRAVFGVHSFSAYNPVTGLFYGIAKVLGQVELALSGELVELFGGSAKYPWNVQEGTQSSDINVTLREYPDFMMELMLGTAPTSNAAEASGSVTAITDKSGTSTVDAATGIASVSLLSGSSADVKFGKYVVKVVSATTVDVYLASDVDLLRGADGTYQNDLLKITASPLTITSGGDTTITNFGLKFTGGSGTIGMTTGDTATFSARPINTKSMDVTIGASGAINPEFGAVIVAEKQGSGQMFEFDVFKCKGNGMPFPLAEKAFSEASLAIKAFQDTTRNGVFSIRQVEPTTNV